MQPDGVPDSWGSSAIVRFYLDYPALPGAAGLGVPQYLIDAGVTMTNYTDHGGGQSPDYHDVRLIDCLVVFATVSGCKKGKIMSPPP